MPNILRKNIYVLTILFSAFVIFMTAVFIILGINDSFVAMRGILVAFVSFAMGHSQWYEKFMIVAPYTVSQKKKIFIRGIIELCLYRSIVSMGIVLVSRFVWGNVTIKMIAFYVVLFWVMSAQFTFYGYYYDISKKSIKILVLMLVFIIFGSLANACVIPNMQLEDYVLFAISMVVFIITFIILCKKDGKEMLAYYCGQ